MTPERITLLTVAVERHEKKAAEHRRRGYLTASAIEEGKALGLRHALETIGSPRTAPATANIIEVVDGDGVHHVTAYTIDGERVHVGSFRYRQVAVDQAAKLAALVKGWVAG